MFYVTIIVLFLLFLLFELILLKIVEDKFNKRYSRLLKREASLRSVSNAVGREFKDLEDKINEAFSVYELARDISPIMDKNRLLNTFKDKLRVFGVLSSLDFLNKPKRNCLNYELKTEAPRYVSVISSSDKVKTYLPLFLHQLNLCLERIDLYKKLQEVSIHDYLTQTYNRRYFMERFHEEFERARKFTFNLSFLMVDIDNFKSLNDTYGHITGDVVLREIGYILKESVREIDFVARFGGEEFSIILTETSKRDAVLVAKRIVKKVASSKLKAFDELIKATVSIGVASYPENTSKADMLIETADKALYKAKYSGRNMVSHF